jgi:hypothetical protein
VISKTESFPYFSIARRAHVSYERVLQYVEHVERLREMNSPIGNYRATHDVKFWSESELSLYVRLEIRDAVKREQYRRAFSGS